MTKEISFQGQLLIAIRKEGKVFVAIKPICEAIGIGADYQVQAIKNHPIMGAAHNVACVQVGEKQSRNMATLELSYLNGWLFTIEPSKVKAEARENLLSYQRECFQVLFEHFFGTGKNVREQEQKRHKLRETLKAVETTIRHCTKQRKRIIKELNEIDQNIGEQLGFFELPLNELPQ